MSEQYSPERWARAFAVDIAVAVAELPDRSSPDDWPEAMLVTASELSAIIEARVLDALETAFESGKDEESVNRTELAKAATELAAWYGPFNPTRHPPEINGAWLRLGAALAT